MAEIPAEVISEILLNPQVLDNSRMKGGISSAAADYCSTTTQRPHDALKPAARSGGAAVVKAGAPSAKERPGAVVLLPLPSCPRCPPYSLLCSSQLLFHSFLLSPFVFSTSFSIPPFSCYPVPRLSTISSCCRFGVRELDDNGKRGFPYFRRRRRLCRFFVKSPQINLRLRSRLSRSPDFLPVCSPCPFQCSPRRCTPLGPCQ